jgi:molecular chaperone Hsp33
MFQDYLFFAVDKPVFYSFRMLHASHLVQEAQRLHQLNTQRALLLSDSLLGCLLLSSLLDYNEQVNLRFHCGDHFTIGCEATFEGNIRGYIDCAEDSPVVKQIDVGDFEQEEILVRSIRTQKNKPQLFEGVTATVTNRLEEALNDHLVSSYQMNTYVRFKSFVDPKTQTLRAFGIIFQELPGIPDEVSKELRQHVLQLPSLEELYKQNDDPDILSSKLLPHELKPIRSLNPKFFCHCNAERIAEALATFPKSDLEDMVSKNESPVVKCHYCSRQHVIDTARVKNILLALDTKYN